MATTKSGSHRPYRQQLTRVLGSLLIHALFIALLWLIPQTDTQLTEFNPAELTYIQVETPPTPAEKDQSKNRLVQTSPGQVVEKSKPDAFLGERNQVVDRETVSEAKLQAAAKGPQATPAEKANPAKQVAVKNNAKQQSHESKTPEQAPAVTVSLDKLGVALPAPGGKQAAVKALVQDRLPSEDGVMSGPSDYIKGLKEGERTALNTQEYVFFGYFQRIRQRLDVSWNHSLREELGKYYKRGRALASDMDHTTKVLVTLNSDGAVTRVQVVGDSGTEDLDTAAVSAFNHAGPFPNPPHGILNHSGEVKIRWDFVLRT